MGVRVGRLLDCFFFFFFFCQLGEGARQEPFVHFRAWGAWELDDGSVGRV